MKSKRNDPSKQTGRSILFLTATVFGVLLPTSAPGQVPQMNAEMRTIRVTGMGEVRTEPDLATVQFAVETTGTTAEEAARANSDTMERVIQAIVGAGVPRTDIQTSGFALFPEYAPPPEPRVGDEGPRIRGYRATNEVSVRTSDLGGIGALIDAALAAGANRMNGVSFELRNSAAAEAEALTQAVANARASAEAMARALGVTLGQVLDASTAAEPPVVPFYRGVAARMEMDQSMAAMTPIEPGQHTVRARASLVFAIE